jgi:hypothetical protein
VHSGDDAQPQYPSDLRLAMAGLGFPSLRSPKPCPLVAQGRFVPAVCDLVPNLALIHIFLSRRLRYERPHV